MACEGEKCMSRGRHSGGPVNLDRKMAEDFGSDGLGEDGGKPDADVVNGGQPYLRGQD